jgi:hypothetical protein
MHYYTYAYLREDKTPYYIGKGTGDRIYSTHKRIKPPKDKSRIIYLKQNLTEAEAFKHEIYMIDVLGRKDLGTGILRNRTNGGEGPSGWVPSEETRRKMSESSKNPSEETRRKISEAQKGHTVSEESKKKMSEAQKGKTTSEETRKRMSEAKKGENNHNYGKTASEETRRKISEAKKGENHHMYGKTHSEETRRKISELKKGRKWWNDGCGNCKFVVECPGDGWKLGRK